MGIRWKTESLGDYYGRVEAGVPDLIGKSSDAVSRKLTKNIKQLTPVGDRKAWTKAQKIKRYGQEWRLKRDINQADILQLGNKWLSGTYTDVPYAPDVEYRTFGPYIIRATNARALRFWSEKEGKYLFRKTIRHPGSDGHYMFMRGTVRTRMAMGSILAIEMNKWIRKYNTAKRTRQRIQKFHTENGVRYSYYTSKAKKK